MVWNKSELFKAQVSNIYYDKNTYIFAFYTGIMEKKPNLVNVVEFFVSTPQRASSPSVFGVWPYQFEKWYYVWTSRTT